MRPGLRKTVLTIVLLFVLALALSITWQLELPAPAGPYTVGRSVIRWVDASRPEVLTENPSDVREVEGIIWYPAQPETGKEAGYFPNLSALTETLVRSEELEWWQVSGLRFIRSDVRTDAIPIKSEIGYPVVIFSPGNGTNMEFYSRLAGEIASHGYVVVGLNHPFDVPAVELSSGEVAAYDKDQWLLDAAAHQAYSAERINVRTADMLFVLDQLDQINRSGPFAGMLNLRSIATAGHSLGGITASNACKADSRFVACLNFDGLQQGGPFSAETTAIPPSQPFLFLTKEPELPPQLIERFESMQESYWVVIHGASHQSFTDGPLLQPSLLPGPNEADRMLGLIQEYTLAFLDQALKGKPSSLLAKTVEGEDVSVKAYPSG